MNFPTIDFHQWFPLLLLSWMFLVSGPSFPSVTKSRGCCEPSFDCIQAWRTSRSMKVWWMILKSPLKDWTSWWMVMDEIHWNSWFWPLLLAINSQLSESQSGGDILVADSETVLVGVSQRTNEKGADKLAKFLFVLWQNGIHRRWHPWFYVGLICSNWVENHKNHYSEKYNKTTHVALIWTTWEPMSVPTWVDQGAVLLYISWFQNFKPTETYTLWNYMM